MPRKNRPKSKPGRKRGQPPGPRRVRPKQKNGATFRFCVEMLTVDAVGQADAIRMIRERYGVAEVTAIRWLNEARGVVRSHEPPTDDRIRMLREQTRAGFEDNFVAARELNDIAQANRALMERAKLYGLYAPIEVKHGGEVSALVSTVPDRKSAELREEIAALTETVRAIEAEVRPSSIATDVSGKAIAPAPAPPVTEPET